MAAQQARDLADELLDEGEKGDRPSSPSPSQERLGGARADFVAALGRRVAELMALVRELAADPGSAALRDDLRRRIHALAAGARLLRFARLAERLCEGEAVLLITAEHGADMPEQIATLRALFEQLPALAWAEAASGDRPSSSRLAPVAVLDAVKVPLGAGGAEQEAPPAPAVALVVGSDRLAEALTADRATFEVERIESGPSALDLARALAPDVIVIDADRPNARDLCHAFVSDPLTESIPVVVAGHFARADEAAPFAVIGAARTVAKPVSPSALRRACAEAIATFARADARRAPLGKVSVEELGDRLAEELRRGLSEAALAQGRGARFDLGEGSEVLGALWGAVARIRDLCTISSSGTVRFAARGPEGAFPIAPWLGDGAEARAASAGEARSGEVPLDRKVVVVADDDPAVTWFLASVLRAAGAVVHEAHDGARALEIAHRATPDLVITDVVMPLLDGFALCRSLKRDLVLRDVPVILLSWKEDLLQRVRELGGGADGYLRKEASAPVILQRVREVLRPRHRVEERLGKGGEVRGRLDGLTTRTLLGLACAARPDATLTVRDAAFLYEVDLRGGRPVRATRTSPEGTFEHGPEILADLLGVGGGRFVVGPASTEAVSVELQGSLDDQLLPRLAVARAAQRLLEGAEIVAVERVDLDEARMGAYLACTPEPARTLLRTLAAGASPRALITSGQAPARLVEDVLADAAAHGAIDAVFDAAGDDLLAPAIARETEILKGVRLSRAPVTVPALDLGPILYTSTPAPVGIVATPVPAAMVSTPAPSAIVSTPTPAAMFRTPVPAAVVSTPAPSSVALTAIPGAVTSTPAPAAIVSTPAPAKIVRTPAPAKIVSTPAPVAIVSALAGTPAAKPVVAAEPAEPPHPPIVLVPDATPRPRAVEPAPLKIPALSSPVAEARPVRPLLTLGSLTPPAVAPVARPLPKAPPAPVITPLEETPSRTVRRPSSFAPAEVPRPASREPREARDPGKPSRTMWSLFAVAGIVFAVGARLSRERELAHAAVQTASDAATPAAPAPADVHAPDPTPSAPASPPEGGRIEGESRVDPLLPQETSLRAEDKVPAGQGMVEIVAGTSDTIWIDGTLVGNGPIVKRALAPRKEPYEIRVRLRGEDRVRFALVKDGRLTRLRIAPPWSR